MTSVADSPGSEDIVCTVPVGTGRQDCGGSDCDAFAGSSTATPHVAGVAALLYVQGRSMTNVERAILTTARNPLWGARGGFSAFYGRGIVDAEAAAATPVG